MTVKTHQFQSFYCCLCTLHVEIYLFPLALFESLCLLYLFFIGMFKQIKSLFDTNVVCLLNIRPFLLLTVYSVTASPVACCYILPQTNVIGAYITNV